MRSRILFIIIDKAMKTSLQMQRCIFCNYKKRDAGVMGWPLRLRKVYRNYAPRFFSRGRKQLTLRYLPTLLGFRRDSAKFTLSLPLLLYQCLLLPKEDAIM